MRRTNGEGSAYHDVKRDRFVYRITYADPFTNLKKRKSFTDKKSLTAAKKKAQEFLNSLKTAGNAHEGSLKAFLEHWVVSISETVKPKTLERYKSILNQNIYPYPVANCLLEKLTTGLLQKHLTVLLQSGGSNKQGLAPRSVNATRRLLIGALDTAVRDDILSKNPATYTRPMKVIAPEIMVLTHEQAKRLIRCALQRSRNAWAIIVLALGTGMRISEIFGLEWKNIDLDAKKLQVEKTVVTTNSGTLIQESTKTKTSRRTILLPDNVCYMLKRFRLWQKVRDIRFATHYSTSPWVLSNPQGKPRSPSSFSGHDFKQLLDLAGIDRKFRIHDMRHTHATWLLEAGVNIKVVSERLGHSSIRITLDTYAHVLQTMQQEAVDTLNDIL
jgi:integrase